jgi:hypothetical protein
MQTEGTESWPVEAASADHGSSNTPPPLVQVARAVPTLTKVEKPAPVAPPPLTEVKRGASMSQLAVAATPVVQVIPPLTEVKKPEANTASLTASQEQGATSVSNSPAEPVATPQIEPQAPSQSEPAPPPALTVVRKGETPPPPPPLETIRPSDWVYLLMGMNVTSERVELCRVVPSKEVEVKTTGKEDSIKSHMRDLVVQDLQKTAMEKENDYLKDRLGNIRIEILEVNAVDRERGVIFRATAMDNGAEEGEERGSPYAVYHWCIVKYLIVSPKRFDLSKAFFGQL